MHWRIAFLAMYLAACSNDPNSHAAGAEPPSGPRKLAPGVLTVIPTAGQESETFTEPLALVGLAAGKPELNWTPHFTPKSQTLAEMAKRVIFRREIWNLEFAFKPLRMIYVDVPQPSGKMQRKLIWYMVYRVKYKGGDLKPVATKDAWGHTFFPSAEGVSYDSRRFFPLFVLESRDFGKAYADRVIPAAKQPIQQRETAGQNLYNTVEITKAPIPLSDDRVDRSVWGLVTWEDIDPRIDFFCIYVHGLTNAFQLENTPKAEQAGQTAASGRQFKFKALQLNFWRPSDDVNEHEEEIRYGVPIDSDPVMQQQILARYGITRRLDHVWVYR
jgi:hypothetical protein